MKLVINYDFFNAILDVNEGYTLMKIVRNNKKLMVFETSMFFLSDFLVTRSIPKSLVITLVQDCGALTGYYYALKNDKNDLYEEIAINHLKKLSIKLKDIYVNTDYNLLLQSELLEKNYKIHLNKSVIPEIIENKYVLVPTYDFNNNIKNICIDQEHIIGTNEYVLSVGSPKKQLKLVYNNI